MKKLLFLFFAVLFLMQITNARNLDAKNLPLLIQNNLGGNGWSPDGKLFVTYTETENKTKLWNLNTDVVLWQVSLNAEPRDKDSLNSQTFVWSGSQKFLIVKDETGKIYLLNSANGKLIRKNEIDKQNLKIITFSLDERQIVLVF